MPPGYAARRGLCRPAMPHGGVYAARLCRTVDPAIRAQRAAFYLFCNNSGVIVVDIVQVHQLHCIGLLCICYKDAQNLQKVHYFSFSSITMHFLVLYYRRTQRTAPADKPPTTSRRAARTRRAGQALTSTQYIRL